MLSVSERKDNTNSNYGVENRWAELEFMHKDIDVRIIPNLRDYYQDAILPVAQDRADAEALASQLSEFIPARIVDNNLDAGFRFPIPSVVNRLRHLNGLEDGMVPLLNRSIPFAYYSIGVRRDEATGNDIDNIAEGSFKWFYGRNRMGVYAIDHEKRSDFVAFYTFFKIFS